MSKALRRWLAIALCCLVAAQMQGEPPSRHASTGRALILSDIHFDPLNAASVVKKLIAASPRDWPAILASPATQSLPSYGSDTNHSLLESALGDAEAHGRYNFVIFGGDALRHNFAAAFDAAGGQPSQFAAFALKAQIYVIDELRRRFGVPVIFAIGNDDSDCGDYRLSPDSHYLAETSREIDTLTSSPEARASFTQGGYYSVAYPGVPRRRIVVLNSVFWSPSYASCAVTAKDPGLVEIDWLTRELAAARSEGQRLTLAMHVPLGIDAYGSAQLADCADRPLLKPVYTVRLDALLRTYKDTVQAVFAGHTHMDDFRLLAADPSAVPIRINPSVSPIFGNNPAYGIYSYDRHTAEPLDMTASYLPLGAPDPMWRNEYRFSAAYDVPAFNRSGVSAALTSIAVRGAGLPHYELNYASSAPSPITASNAAQYTCAQSNFVPSQYRRCVCPP